MRAKARLHKPGQMNKGEAAYAAHLEQRKRAGEIHDYRFEPMKLRLADNTFYSPDFEVMLPEPDARIEMHEVKPTRKVTRADGSRVEQPFCFEDAKLKVKVAAKEFYEFIFAIVYPLKAGGWGRQEF